MPLRRKTRREVVVRAEDLGSATTEDPRSVTIVDSPGISLVIAPILAWREKRGRQSQRRDNPTAVVSTAERLGTFLPTAPSLRAIRLVTTVARRDTFPRTARIQRQLLIVKNVCGLKMMNERRNSVSIWWFRCVATRSFGVLFFQGRFKTMFGRTVVLVAEN
jgi:hypothetical protein